MLEQLALQVKEVRDAQRAVVQAIVANMDRDRIAALNGIARGLEATLDRAIHCFLNPPPPPEYSETP